MIIITVKNSSSIDQALKQYKFKVYKTKQLEKLKELQEFTKNSVKKREQNKKSVYLQKKKSQLESWVSSVLSWALSNFFSFCIWCRIYPEIPNSMDAYITISVIDKSEYFFKRKKTIPHCATINDIPDSSLFLEKNHGIIFINFMKLPQFIEGFEVFTVSRRTANV